MGDHIQGTARQEAHAAAAGAVNTESGVRELPTGAAREELLRRVRQLKSNTEVHIPVALRDRHASILANVLGDIANGRPAGCFFLR